MQTRNRTVHSPFGCLFSLPIVNNTTGSPSPAYAGGLTGGGRRWGGGRPCTLTRDLHLKLLAGALFSLYRLANNGSGFRPPPIALVLALPRDARFPFERFHHLVADTQIHLHTQTHTHTCTSIATNAHFLSISSTLAARRHRFAVMGEKIRGKIVINDEPFSFHTFHFLLLFLSLSTFPTSNRPDCSRCYSLLPFLCTCLYVCVCVYTLAKTVNKTHSAQWRRGFSLFSVSL